MLTNKNQQRKNNSEVVIALPYIGNRILMQLRDDYREDIYFPGYWGFFGGAIDRGEQPKKAVLRELKEEIGYEPEDIYLLETIAIPELDNIITHAFFCQLTVGIEELTLTEGMDLGLFTEDEVKIKELYSKRMKRLFPVVPLSYIYGTMEKLWVQVKNNT